MAPPRLWISACTVSLSSFLFGYCLSSLNTPLQVGPSGDPLACYTGEDPGCPAGSLLRDIKLSSAAQEAAQGALIAGAWLGSLLAAKPSEAHGRRYTLLRLNALFILGALLSTLPYEVPLLLGRALLGLAVGCEAAVVPVLLAEVSPAELRGKVVGCHQLAITIGIAAAGGFGAVLSDVTHGWRWLQAAIAMPAILQLLGNKLVPESPRWLLQHTRETEARETLIKLRRGSGVPLELSSMAEKAAGSATHCTWGEVFARKRMVMLGVSIMAFAALTGINSVILYSTTVFALAGVQRSTLVTATVSLANVIATLVAQSLVDRSGRRALLLRGAAIQVVSLLLLSLSLLLLGFSPLLQGAVAVAGCLSFIVGYAIGFGAVGWTYVSEVVPSRLRSKAFGLFVSTNWFANLLISSLTLTAIEGLGGGAHGVAYLYLIFALISAAAFLFMHVNVQETMGRSLEETSGEDQHHGSGAATAAGDDEEHHDATEEGGIAVTSAYVPLASDAGYEKDSEQLKAERY